MIVPVNEVARIAALKRYHILDTPPDGAFDRITAVAAKMLKVPIAIISLVDNDRIWFKSHHGLKVNQIAREPGLCASAIMLEGLYLVNDAKIDPRTLANPLVAGSFGLRFYAAVPLKTNDGFNLGTLCCLDYEPKEISEEQAQILEDLAEVVMDQMELRLAARHVNELHEELQVLHENLRQQASHDFLTKLWNRGAVMDIFNQLLARARREKMPLSIMLSDIDFFKLVNDNHGHNAGDKVLQETAQRLTATLRNSDTVGRVGGEEFLCILYPCDKKNSIMVSERCRLAVCNTPVIVGELHLNTSISIGIYSTENNHSLTVEQMLKKADDALYSSKRNGRNRVTMSE